jgi:hypothetical protein
VLVHRLYADGSSWIDVIPYLQRAGEIWATLDDGREELMRPHPLVIAQLAENEGIDLHDQQGWNRGTRVPNSVYVSLGCRILNVLCELSPHANCLFSRSTHTAPAACHRARGTGDDACAGA